MELDEIKFSTNWNNKLNNKSFSTIRIFNSNKYIVGAKIEFEKGFYLNQLSMPMAYLDTGYSRNETIEILKKMYKNKIDLKFHYIILNKL
jgi:hypothetical protein